MMARHLRSGILKQQVGVARRSAGHDSRTNIGRIRHDLSGARLRPDHVGLIVRISRRQTKQYS